MQIFLHITSGAKGLSFYHPGSIPVVSTFAWVGYSISKDRHEEAVDMIPWTGFKQQHSASDETIDPNKKKTTAILYIISIFITIYIIVAYSVNCYCVNKWCSP